MRFPDPAGRLPFPGSVGRRPGHFLSGGRLAAAEIRAQGLGAAGGAFGLFRGGRLLCHIVRQNGLFMGRAIG